MAEKITTGTLVRVKIPTHGRGIPIKTTSFGPLAGDIRSYFRRKTSKRPNRFLFGTVIGGPYEAYRDQARKDQECLVQWAGKRHRTSYLPVGTLVYVKNE